MKKVCLLLTVIVLCSFKTSAYEQPSAQNNQVTSSYDEHARESAIATIIELCQKNGAPEPAHLIALLLNENPRSLDPAQCQQALQEIDAIITQTDDSAFITYLEQAHALVNQICNTLTAETEPDELVIFDDLIDTPVKGSRETVCNLLVKNLLKVCGHAYIEGQLVINPRRSTRASYPLLVVNGNSDINGTLTVDNFFVEGTTTLGNVVFDNLAVNGNLSVVGGSTLSTLAAASATLSALTVNGTSNVNGQTNVSLGAGQTLAVNGGLFEVDHLGNTTTNDLIVNGTFALPPFGNTTINGTLDVTGATTLQNTLSVTGASSLNGLTAGTTTLNSLGVTNNTSVGGNVTVTGTSNLGILNAGSSTLNSLDVTNNTTVGGTLAVTGNTTLSSASITNNATVGGTLEVTGTTTLSNTLAVNPVAGNAITVNGTDFIVDFQGNTITNDLTVNGTFTVPSLGNTTINGTLDVTGVSTFNSTVNMTPLTAVDALVITPNASSVDGIQINNPTNAGAGGFALRIDNNVPTAVFSVAHTSGNTLIGGTLGVTGTSTLGVVHAGATSVTTLGSSGLATLNSLSVTPGDASFAANINLPNTANANVGVIEFGGVPYFHNYANNLFVGAESGNFTTTGSSNCCFGDLTGDSLTTGNGNLFMGIGAGRFMESGNYNIIGGFFAGGSLTSGNDNIIFGSDAAGTLITGTSNVIIGDDAANNSTNLSSCVIIGPNAGNVIATGSFNTFVGTNTANSLSTGDQNSFFGFNAGASILSGDNNLMLASNGPSAAISNQVYLGNGTHQALYFLSNDGTGTSIPDQAIAGSVVALTIDPTTGNVGKDASSARYKTDIMPIANEQVNILSTLEPVSYRVNHSHNAQAYGLIAEQVVTVDPLLVAFNSDGQPDAVHYQMIIPLLIKAYQLQQERVSHLETEISILKSEIQSA